MSRLPRGWARHILTFVVVATVTALPWVFISNLIWNVQ